MPSRLDGKTVLVVGAEGNLGPVWVEAALREGARVLGLGLEATKDHSLGRLAKEYPGLTVSDVDISVQLVLEDLSHAFGRELGKETIDGVVLNAGIDSLPGTGKAHLQDYDIAEWQRIFAVNLFGVVGVLNTVLPLLANPSSVVMVGSLYGLVSPKPALYSHFNGGKGSLKHPAYGASKAALVAVAKQYGTHLAPQGVRVNTLTLGGVSGGQDAEFVKKFENHVPQGKMMSNDELAGALLFLLSDESLAMTGHNLVLDGGFTAW